MQANFQLLTGDLAIGGGLHLPVTQPWAATNIVYWVNGYFVVICIRQILDIVPYFVSMQRLDSPDLWGHFTLIWVGRGNKSQSSISQITGGGQPWSLETLSFETGLGMNRDEIVESMTQFLIDEPLE